MANRYLASTDLVKWRFNSSAGSEDQLARRGLQVFGRWPIIQDGPIFYIDYITSQFTNSLKTFHIFFLSRNKVCQLLPPCPTIRTIPVVIDLLGIFRYLAVTLISLLAFGIFTKWNFYWPVNHLLINHAAFLRQLVTTSKYEMWLSRFNIGMSNRFFNQSIPTIL